MSNKPRGLLGVLRKAGLIEIQDAEAAPEPALTEPAADPAPAAAEPAPAAPASAGAAGEVEENLPLEQIYADGRVPPSPFPAERLLKVLNGLRAMDVSLRKAAIMAMDAADDNWKIEDVLLDAEHKIKALDARKQFLAAQAQAAADSARTEIQRREQKQQQAVAAIRQQIAEMQALMEREVAGASRDKHEAEARAAAAAQACARESTRLDGEIARLKEIPATFGEPPKAG
jgi:hypothetical protein